MKVYGDVEHVNLATGERFRRVCGDGESRLERIGEPLTKEQRTKVEQVFDEAKRNVEEYQKQQKLQPYHSFIERAVEIGFTKEQAEFLWGNLLREWRA